ncbi:Uu.00g029490.m01.CDS01 [Anthostomella pinea]|uniref:U6 snRNA phosphodiesterase n=1 Tax=Anthostomella pinea TaxID=933095 RepID=A0AAI8V948_9PEZI|nr:Uu.00g029490.m01.CDS01 [Anthostomella pinea]
MPLVDYSSSDSESAAESSALPPTAKKQKTAHNAGTPSSNRQAQQTALPPLPSAFHDLYASTVRVSTSDDPALHQGRKRVHPHKAGHWPTHLYIEWHPTNPERTHLSTLLTTIQTAISSLTTTSSNTTTNPITLSPFLTSDLGAPQPLHISLSRPLALTTAQRDAFLSQLRASIGSSGVQPFALAPLALEWHRTRESERSFLVLRVGSVVDDAASASTLASGSASAFASEQDGAFGRDQPRGSKRKATENGDRGHRGGDATNPNPNPNPNPDLTALLTRSNALSTSFDQPALYAFKSPSNTSHTPNTANTPKNPPSTSTDSPNPSQTSDWASTAFHISLAWSFAPPTPALRRATADAFDAFDTPGKKTGTETTEPRTGTRDAVLAMRIRVDGLKAKIGNVVTHVPLPVRGKSFTGRDRGGGGGKGLFGV